MRDGWQRLRGRRGAGGGLAGRGLRIGSLGGLWTAEGVGLAVTLVQGILVARWIGPAALGTAALAVAYPTVVLTVADTRSYDTTVRFLSEFHGRGDRLRAVAVCRGGYGVDALTAASSFLFVLATASVAARHLVHTPGAELLVVVYAAGLVADFPASTGQAVLTTLGRFQMLAGLRIAGAVVRSGLILLLVVRGWGPSGIVVGSALGLAADGAARLLVARRLVRREWGRASLASCWQALSGRRREMVRFIVWADAASVFGLLAKQADTLVLGLFRGPADVGLYRLAKSLASLAGTVIAPLETVAYPQFARLWGTWDEDGLRTAVRHQALRLGLPVAAAGLLVLPLVPVAIRITVGERFLPAVPMAHLLIAAGAAWAASFWVGPLILALGRVRFWAALATATAIPAVLGSAAAAPAFGGTGVALVQLVTRIFGPAVAVVYLRRRTTLLGGRAPVAAAGVAGG